MSKIKRLYLWVLALVFAVSSSSCGEESYEDSYLVGRWALISVNNYPVAEANSYDLIFYDNGTGVRDHFSYEVPFSWSDNYNPQGAEYLYIRTYQGYEYNYIMRMEYSYDDYLHMQRWFLYLTDLDTGDILLFEEY